MNEHLRPIFETVLPAIEAADIEYWVFGGIAIAGLEGRFVRKNNDVDIVVYREKYRGALDAIEASRDKTWTYKDTNFARPKREFFVPDRKEDILSIMPIYRNGATVTIQFQKSKKNFPTDTWGYQKRVIGSYSFFTPTQNALNELFIENLRYLAKRWAKGDKLDLKPKYEEDGRIILTPKEREEFFSQKK
ncbi:MAG: hypothetical protein WC052_03685 [Patescibacteria group bacterium]|jgi:hypothetical protein